MATKALSIHPSNQGVCGRHGAEEHVVTPGDLIECLAHRALGEDAPISRTGEGAVGVR